MTVEEMHFDFKEKMNKVDSQQFANYRVPEIDRFLNEGQTLFLKNIASPRKVAQTMVDKTQRTTDDIRTAIKESPMIPARGDGSDTFSIKLPADYMFYLKGMVTMSKGGENRECRLFLRQHRQWYSSTPYYDSSYEWREAAAVIDGDTIKVSGGGNTIVGGTVTYICRLPYIHYAQGFKPGGTYIIEGTKALTGKQDCLLPPHTHSEVVDLAVLVAKGITEGYMAARDKLAIDTLT